MSFLLDRLNSVSPARKTLFAAALIFVLTLAAYSNTFHADFHFDDFHQIVNNQNIRKLENLPRFFTDASLVSHIVGNKGYRPLITSSYAINYAISGYSVWSYHVFNLLLHFLNALLVFLVIRAVLEKAGGKEEFTVPLLISLVYALHPIQTGAVTYISGRAVLLASLFYLLAFYCFVRYRACRATGAGHGYIWAAVAPVLYLMGLLSKEMAVSLIGVMLAYDLIFTFPGQEGIIKRAKAALYYIPFLASLTVSLAWRRALTGYATAPSSGYGTGEYLMSEAKALLLYLRLLVLPINQNTDYYLPVTGRIDTSVLFGILVLLAALVFIYRLRKKKPAVSFLGAWFLLTLAPESSFIPIIDIAVEYRLYLPSVGLIVIAILIAAEIIKRPATRKGLVFAVVVLFGVLTYSRNTVWATAYSYWSDVAKKSPHSDRAHADLGYALLGMNRYTEAVKELNRALEINPFYDQSEHVYRALGICYHELGKAKEAITAFERAIKVNPGYAEGYTDLGAAYYKQGRYAESADALLMATKLDPGYNLAHFNLARSYYKLGRRREALAQMEEARGLSPRDFITTLALAIFYYNNGMVDKARDAAGEALSLAQDEDQRNKAQALIDRLNGP